MHGFDYYYSAVVYAFGDAGIIVVCTHDFIRGVERVNINIGGMLGFPNSSSLSKGKGFVHSGCDFWFEVDDALIHMRYRV